MPVRSPCWLALIACSPHVYRIQFQFPQAITNFAMTAPFTGCAMSAARWTVIVLTLIFLSKRSGPSVMGGAMTSIEDGSSATRWTFLSPPVVMIVLDAAQKPATRLGRVVRTVGAWPIDSPDLMGRRSLVCWVSHHLNWPVRQGGL